MTHDTARRHRRALRLTTALAGLGLVGAALLTGSPASVAAAGDAGSTDATFSGTGFGAIPDATACGPTPGVARDVTFTVSGLPQRALGDVRITGLTFSPNHTFVGDLIVTLIAPNATSTVIFGRTSATTAGAVGDNSNAAGPYTFADDAAGGWWAAAAAANGTDAIVASGSYRTSQLGGAGATGTATNLTAAFSGVTNPNGTWTLRFTDGCSGDTGTVSAATLGLTPVAPDCTAQQTAVTNAQNAKTAADAAVASAQTAANTADAAVPPAQAAADAAQAAETKAQGDATAAQAAATKASAAVKKAKGALKKAKKSGNAAKVKKAKKKLKAATAALKAANAANTQAQAGLASAKAANTKAQGDLAAAKANAVAKHTALDNAKAQQTTANTNLAAAQAALTACQASRPAA